MALVDYVQEPTDLIAGLQRDVRAEHLRYENLKRDKAAEAREHGLFPKVRELFDYWRKVCRHPNSKYTPDRFTAALPYLEKYGEATCRRAIDGAAFDPYERPRKNASMKRFDSWSGYPSSIFASADKFEDFANRAPQKAREDDVQTRPGSIAGGAGQGEPSPLRTPGRQSGGQVGLPGLEGAGG